MQRNHSFSDRIIAHIDNALKTLSPGAVNAREPNPGDQIQAPELTETEQKHIAGLMRINHTGEVCAQALYKGQSLTAKLADVRDSMEAAADEELDHLAWCDQRLKELNARTSILNPIFYAMSYSLGALAGAAGDKWSLGFVAATEDQVSLHLKDHLEQIETKDDRSTAIVKKMLEDEERHAQKALDAGGVAFPPAVKRVMTTASKVMTKTTYRI